MPRWSVDIIRKRAERLGSIEAANEKQAIEKRLRNLIFRRSGRTGLSSRR